MTGLQAGAQTNGTPGAVLAAARQAAGLTPADVAGQMRISLRQLEAIEADRYDALPGTVFVRGFVRNYARLLNLDPGPLLHALDPALGVEVPLRAQQFAGSLPVHSRRGHIRLWVGLFIVLLLVVLGTAAYELWRGRSASPVSSVPEVAPAVTSVEPKGPITAVEPVTLAPERLSQQASEPAASAAPTQTSSASVVSAPAATTAESTPALRGGRLELSFVAESWVEVRDKESNVIFSATGSANTTRSVEGAPPLTVTVGNASGVRITYNHKPVDVAANANRNIARLTLE